MAIRYIDNGYNNNQIAYAVMKCISKTLQKIVENLKKEYDLPIFFIGGVRSSQFLKLHFKRNNITNIHFEKSNYGIDNTIRVSIIGLKAYYKYFLKENNFY